MTIDSGRPVTTFCLFFERGFVEDVYRAQVTASRTLLDAPQPARPFAVEFPTRIEPPDGPLMKRLKRFQEELRTGRMSQAEWDGNFLQLAGQLILGRSETAEAMAHLPALRDATRAEVYRRLLRGRDFLLSSLNKPIRLKDMAAAACLSPFSLSPHVYKRLPRNAAPISHPAPAATGGAPSAPDRSERHGDLSGEWLREPAVFQRAFSAPFRRVAPRIQQDSRSGQHRRSVKIEP